MVWHAVNGKQSVAAAHLQAYASEGHSGSSSVPVLQPQRPAHFSARLPAIAKGPQRAIVTKGETVNLHVGDFAVLYFLRHQPCETPCCFEPITGQQHQ